MEETSSERRVRIRLRRRPQELDAAASDRAPEAPPPAVVAEPTGGPSPPAGVVRCPIVRPRGGLGFTYAR
jgi:hypothetical protein